MRKAAATLLFTMVGLLTGGLGGYFYGLDRGSEQGYRSGHDVGYADAQKNYVAPKTYFVEYQDVLSKYNNLVSDYNKLAAISRYQTRQPLSCNSMTYGTNNQFTSTNCY